MNVSKRPPVTLGIRENGLHNHKRNAEGRRALKVVTLTAVCVSAY